MTETCGLKNVVTDVLNTSSFNDSNISLLSFLLKTVNSNLDKYAILTRISRKMDITYSKPWLTKGNWHQLTAKIKYTKNFVKQKNKVGKICYIVNIKSIGILLET